jgi:hypothetical protein
MEPLNGSPPCFLLVTWESYMTPSRAAMHFFIAIQIWVKDSNKLLKKSVPGIISPYTRYECAFNKYAEWNSSPLLNMLNKASHFMSNTQISKSLGIFTLCVFAKYAEWNCVPVPNRHLCLCIHRILYTKLPKIWLWENCKPKSEIGNIFRCLKIQ